MTREKFPQNVEDNLGDGTEPAANLPDVIRHTRYSENVQFAGSVALSNEAGLEAWFTEHVGRSYEDKVDLEKALQKEFAKPVPREATAQWRTEAGYEYGDKLPAVTYGIGIDPDDRDDFTVRYDYVEHKRTFPRSGLRIDVGLPHKNDDTAVSVLELPVRVAKGITPEGGLRIPELKFHVGEEIGISTFDEVSERGSQELNIVAQRLFELSTGVASDKMTAKLPYDTKKEIASRQRSKRRERRFGF